MIYEKVGKFQSIKSDYMKIYKKN